MIVIPMAGMSSRFTKAGYDKPKWMLPLAGRPLLDWSLLGFSEYFREEPFLVVYLDRPGVRDFIEQQVKAVGIETAHYVPLQEVTRGQAETVYLGLQAVDVREDEPLTIFNIDTIRPKFIKSERLLASDGWLECFKGEGEHWSFVKASTKHPGVAVQVTEKKRISDNCCTGMYYFRSASLYDAYYQKEIIDQRQPELYVAPIYQRMISDGLKVHYDVIGPDDIVFSGTPAEYEDARLCEAELAAKF